MLITNRFIDNLLLLFLNSVCVSYFQPSFASSRKRRQFNDWMVVGCVFGKRLLVVARPAADSRHC